MSYDSIQDTLRERDGGEEHCRAVPCHECKGSGWIGAESVFGKPDDHEPWSKGDSVKAWPVSRETTPTNLFILEKPPRFGGGGFSIVRRWYYHQEIVDAMAIEDWEARTERLSKLEYNSAAYRCYVNGHYLGSVQADEDKAKNPSAWKAQPMSRLSLPGVDPIHPEYEWDVVVVLADGLTLAQAQKMVSFYLAVAR